MRNYKENEFSIKLMIMLRDERNLEECLDMQSKFKETIHLDDDTMEIILTELEIAIKDKL